MPAWKGYVSTANTGRWSLGTLWRHVNGLPMPLASMFASNLTADGVARVPAVQACVTVPAFREREVT